jgi:hypothetical protein
LRRQGSKLVWDLLILKILDSRSNGEAPTSEIASEIAVLDRAARDIFPPDTIDGGIFGAGFVTNPRKAYVRSVHRKASDADGR